MLCDKYLNYFHHAIGILIFKTSGNAVKSITQLVLTYHTLQWQLTKYAIMADQSTDKCNVTVTKIINVVHGLLTKNKSL